MLPRVTGLGAAALGTAVFVAGCTGGASGPTTSTPGVTSAPASSATSTGSMPDGSTGPVSSGAGSTGAGAPTGSILPTTAPSVTPVTDSGMVTGPGVDDASISLGVIVDPDRDRGFTAGLDVWRDSVNSTGGICGRTVELVAATAGLSGQDAYRDVGRNTLGLILLPQNASRPDLWNAARSDGIPALTPEGHLTDLTGGAGSPVVLGATEDVIAINTAAGWLADGILTTGATLGVLVDDVPDGDGPDRTDAVAGLSWWAARNDVTLEVLEPGEPIPASVGAIYAAAAPGAIGDLLRQTTVTPDGAATDAGSSGAGSTPAGSTPAGSTSAGSSSASTSVAGSLPASTSAADSSPAASAAAGSSEGGSSDAGSSVGVAPDGATDGTVPPDAGTFSVPAGPIVGTTIDGYLPQDIPTDQAGRLQVATVTPSFGAQHPVASAVQEAFLGSGATPGIRSLEGYATGEAWTRLLEPMCAARTLTRSAAAALLASAGPAAPDSLFGPTLPANQVTSGLPASRVSALSVADPATPAGLRPLSLLESAPAIGDYRTES